MSKYVAEQLKPEVVLGDGVMIVVFGFSGIVFAIKMDAFTQSLLVVPSFILKAAVQFSPFVNIFVAFCVNVDELFVAFATPVMFVLKCSFVPFQKTIVTVMLSASGSDTNEDAFKLEFVLIMLSVANGCANIYGVALFGIVVPIHTDELYQSEFITPSFDIAAQVQFCPDKNAFVLFLVNV